MEPQKSHSNARELGRDMLAAFTKRRKQLLWMSLTSIGLTFVSLAIVGTRLFYPFHMVLGVTVYLLSLIPFARRVYLGRKTWQTYSAYTSTARFFRRERRRLVAGVCMVAVSAVFLYLRPLDERPFAHLSDDEIRTLIQDDLYTSVTAMDYLETTGNALLGVLSQEEENIHTVEATVSAFEDFLDAVVFSESLTDQHRYFASIPYHLWDERTLSFLISYSLYVKKYEMVHRILTMVAEDDFRKNALNNDIPVFGKGNLYDEMVVRYYAPKTKLRITGGYYYLLVFLRERADRAYEQVLLREKSVGSYAYLSDNFVPSLRYTGGVLMDTTERRMFDKWFPIQKTVASAMGRAILSTRGKDGFITPSQAMVMGKSMEPGDIMLQRRNWHVSNVGIPGFWTHATIYTGDLPTMDTYFSSEFPYKGYDSFSALMKEVYPEVYAQYQTPDVDGGQRAVLEAIAQGVILQSLSVSADADFVAVLRPNLSKKDIRASLERAFSHVGKPYDFNFDFNTSDALVCSELVYDAFFPREPEKYGLHFETSVVNGRKMVSPMDMVQTYVDERGSLTPQLQFVYFLRGSEEEKRAETASESDFLESVTWSKFSFLTR